jgi:hypothetical protein
VISGSEVLGAEPTGGCAAWGADCTGKITGGGTTRPAAEVEAAPRFERGPVVPELVPELELEPAAVALELGCCEDDDDAAAGGGGGAAWSAPGKRVPPRNRST